MIGLLLNLEMDLKSGKQNYHNLRHWSKVRRLAKSEGLDVQHMLKGLRK